jgi:hypothetical protein
MTGWKLVPITPTDEMLNAAQERLCMLRNVTHFDDYLEAARYTAMVEAAPSFNAACLNNEGDEIDNSHLPSSDDPANS